MNQQKLLLEFDKLCERIKKTTPVQLNESEQEKKLRIKKLLKDYNAFAKYYFPDAVYCDCAQFHIDTAKKILKNPRGSYILRFFRGAAKSVHANLIIPFYLMAHQQLQFMVLIGQNLDTAKRLLSDIQAQLMENQRIIHDFGTQFNYGDWQEGEFTTKNGIKFLALGMGQSPRGLRNGAYRPDYIVCDDLDTAEMSRNKNRIQDAVNWILEDLMGCFDVGNARFVLAGNLFSKNSINYLLSQNPAFETITVNALDEKAKPTWKQKYTPDYFEEIKKRIGTRSFLREYMNTPVETGKVFQPEWIQWKSLPPDFFQKASIIIYCDPSYSAKGDYKAIKVWAKYEHAFWLIDAFVRQTTLSDMVQKLYHFHELYPNAQIFMEEQFIQDYFMQEIKRYASIKGYLLPLKRDKRVKPNKIQRIEALTPLYENGYIFYRADKKADKDFETSIEQLLLFGEGSSAHDDSPDADEGAIYLLNKKNIRNDKQKAFLHFVDNRKF